MERSTLDGEVVLVTGASGFIGQHLVRRLLRDANAEILGLARSLSNEKATRLWGSVARLKPLQGDLSMLDRSFWNQHEIDQIDYVFHLGAFTPKSHADFNKFDVIYKSNLLGTQRLLQSLPSIPKSVIYASTLDVYAPLAGNGILTEDSPIAPVSVYGASKFFGETLVKLYAQQYGARYAILRYGHIYGPGEEAYKKLIPETIRKVLAGESPVLYGDGSTERDFLYIEDVVEATLRAAISPYPQLGPINIVRGESVPIYKVVEQIIECCRSSVQITYLKDRPAGRSLRFDNSRMFKVLGRWPLVSLEDGLRAEVKHFRSFLNDQHIEV